MASSAVLTLGTGFMAGAQLCAMSLSAKVLGDMIKLDPNPSAKPCESLEFRAPFPQVPTDGS